MVTYRGKLMKKQPLYKFINRLRTSVGYTQGIVSQVAPKIAVYKNTKNAAAPPYCDAFSGWSRRRRENAPAKIYDVAVGKMEKVASTGNSFLPTRYLAQLHPTKDQHDVPNGQW